MSIFLCGVTFARLSRIVYDDTVLILCTRVSVLQLAILSKRKRFVFYVTD